MVTKDPSHEMRPGSQKGALLPRKMRRGFVVFGLLLTLEAIEYAVGTGMKRSAWLFLAPLAIVGAWPIVQYFMHITQLWRPEE